MLLKALEHVQKFPTDQPRSSVTPFKTRLYALKAQTNPKMQFHYILLAVIIGLAVAAPAELIGEKDKKAWPPFCSLGFQSFVTLSACTSSGANLLAGRTL